MYCYREKWRPVYILADVHCKQNAIFGLVAAHATHVILKIILIENSPWPANIAYKCVYTAELYRSNTVFEKIKYI